MDRAALYQDAIKRRRAFALPGYTSLAEVGLDGDYVVPIQMTSGNLEGPLLISKDWLDAPSARANADILARQGFLPNIPYNRVLDMALALVGLKRRDVYISTIFALLPAARSSVLPAADARASFEAVGQYELMGRRPIAAGKDAVSTLRKLGVDHIETRHPSARGLSFSERARQLADALEAG